MGSSDWPYYKHPILANHLSPVTFVLLAYVLRAKHARPPSALFTIVAPSPSRMDPVTAAQLPPPGAPPSAPPAMSAPAPVASLAPAPHAPPVASAQTPHRSPKRVRLSPAQKQAVCDLLAGGARPDYIVDTFGIAKRTVFKIQRAQRLRLGELLGGAPGATSAKSRDDAASASNAPAASNVQLADDNQLVASLAASSVGMSADVLMTTADGADPTAMQAVSAATATGSSGSLVTGADASSGATGATTTHPAPKKSSPPAKRVRLNVAEKLEICNFVQRGGTPNAVISKYGISRRTFFKILHDEQCIRQTVDRDHVSAETKSIRPPHFPLLDQALSAFVLAARAARIPLNWHMVRQQALLLRQELLVSGKERPERVPHLERFTASEHWCQLFMRKNASKKLPAALDDPVQPARRHAMKETKLLHTQLVGFNADNVYTLVIPRLYYRHIPKRFFSDRDSSEPKQESDSMDVETTPIDSTEPFVTLMIAANLMGTKRLPITMIVPPSLQKTFETRKPIIPYMCRPMQRCDNEAMTQWLRESFAPFVSAHNGCKVALMMDEALLVGSSLVHPSIDQISLVPVPKLSVCMQDTARKGMFPLLVARYRFKLFETYSALVPLRQQLRKHAEILIPTHRGLAEGHDATIFDAADLIRESWDEIHGERIARAWWRVHVLPDAIVSQLETMYGRKTNDIDIINDVASFVLGIVRTNPVGKEGLTSIANGKRWISVLEVIRWFTFEYEKMMPVAENDWGTVQADEAAQPDDSALGQASDETHKWSHVEFAQVMKYYADLERCIVRDSEALRNLRNAKKASLANFVLNGAAAPPVENENGIN